MADAPVGLFQQLELSRFERALATANSIAQNRALLTNAELERLNQILTGKQDDPWRDGPVDLTLPSGKTETLHLLRDPRVMARECLHQSTEMAENGYTIDAALEAYTGLVLSHVFKDANRRTAVVAAHYFLQRYGVPLSGLALHELGLGDLREPGQKEALRDTIVTMARFAAKRSGK